MSPRVVLIVASDANVGLQWIDPAFTQQLCVVASRLLDHEPPFVVMTLRGRLYLRLQLEEPKAAAVAQALALFQAAATAASNLRGSKELKFGAARRLSIDVDVFNVLNAKNPFINVTTRRLSSTGAPLSPFMQPAAYAGDFGQPEQRVGQIGFRLTF